MIGIFNTISIDGDEIYNGNGFTLQREWIYAGEVVTCTGKVCADVVGWRYSNVNISWDNLPQDQLAVILELSGSAVEMEFKDEQNNIVTEEVIPIATTAQATRLTDPNGDSVWSGIGLEIRFINAHN